MQTLLATHKATVTSVEPETGRIEYEPSKALKPGLAVFAPTGLVPLTSLAEDHFLGSGSNLPQVGSTLSQKEPIASREAIFEAFRKEWEARWDRHKEVPEARWEPFNTWVHKNLPRAEESMPLPDITIAQWKAEIRRKKTKTACGLDGLSRDDLLAMPDCIHARIISVLHQVEQGKPWPQACMQGVVAALQKEPDAQWVNVFRPITILSLLGQSSLPPAHTLGVPPSARHVGG